MRAIQTLFSIAALSALSFAQISADQLKPFAWTSQGPDRGGRSIACVGVNKRPGEFYFGATGGGVWKTTDNGKNWSCVSDGFFKTSSVGALAVSASNPDVVYAGMGERDIRGNAIEGDGIYKSTDAGRTWTHVGLEKCGVISRILVDPNDPNIVYVAALGHIFAKNPERGIYKSTDGGKTWAQVLYSTDGAGGNSLEMDPFDSKTLYASTWECSRKPWEMISGGPGSKIFKSIDAGTTWTEISKAQGLPSGILGKVCFAPSPALKGRVWAMVEAADAGLYRSDDAGQTWKLCNKEPKIKQRPWYFSRVVADPLDKDTVYVCNVGFHRSTDGGTNFKGVSTPHGDNHDLWIAPIDSKIMIEANDGGAAVSLDKGATWSALKMPTAQFYHVSIDSERPLPHILGAQQDNSTVRLNLGGFGTNRWTSTAGGESGYVTPKPDNPDIVFGGNYGGELELRDHRNNKSYSMDPYPDEPLGHGAIDATYRFQWTYPIIFSPFDPNVLYVCSQHVMRSLDLGHSWEDISPDLTRNDPATLGSSGGPLTKDNTGVEVYGTVFTVAESTKTKGLLWAGTDDGLVWVKRPNGKWTNVTPAGLPKFARISMVEASALDEATAYVAANNYQQADNAVYLYRTHDFGKHWTAITNGIPADSYARVLRADPVVPGLLYAGTETGAWLSFNDGDTWQPVADGLPVTPVHDLAIWDNMLVAATHGRGFYTYEHLAALRAIATKHEIAGPQAVYRARPTLKVDAYFADAPKQLMARVYDAKGIKLSEEKVDGVKGWKNYSVSLSHKLTKPLSGLTLWDYPTSQIAFAPGIYTLKLEGGALPLSYEFKILRDPHSLAASDADVVAQVELARKVGGRLNELFRTMGLIQSIRTQWEADKAKPGLSEALKAEGDALLSDLTVVETTLHQTKSHAEEDPLNFPTLLSEKFGRVLNHICDGEHKPTQQALRVFNVLNPQLSAALDRYASLTGKRLDGLNAKLLSAGSIALVPKYDPDAPNTETKPRLDDDDQT